MLSVPSNEQVLLGIAHDLEHVVLAAVNDDTVKVAVQMMCQILTSAAVRSAHEIAWMLEEIDDILEAVAVIDHLPAIQAERDAVLAAHTASLHLDDVRHRYHLAGQLLSTAIDEAYRTGDATAIDAVRQALLRRNEHELAIVGQLELVGR